MRPRETTDRQGHRIAFSVEGEGPLVLLVQGLGLSSPTWLLAFDRLLAMGFRVAAIDNRGTGLSDVPLPPYSMRTMAADVAHVIDRLGGPAIVAGISLGGMIAQHVAIHHPASVEGLVLAATTVGNPFGKLPRPAVLGTLVRGMLGDRKSMVKMRRHLVHPSNLERNPDLFREFDRVIVSEGVRWQAVLGQLLAAWAHNTYFAARRIQVPVEVLTGDSDELVPTVNSLILRQRIPDCSLTVLPRAGHAFPLEHPSAIPDAVRRVAERAGHRTLLAVP